MSYKDSVSTVITFEGNDASKVIDTHREVIEAIWDAVKCYLHATIVVQMTPSDNNKFWVDWVMQITSPAGRRTLRITQTLPNKRVVFTNE